MVSGHQSFACLFDESDTSARVHLFDMGQVAAICNIRVTQGTAVPASRSVTPIIADSGSVTQDVWTLLCRLASLSTWFQTTCDSVKSITTEKTKSLSTISHVQPESVHTYSLMFLHLSNPPAVGFTMMLGVFKTCESCR